MVILITIAITLVIVCDLWVYPPWWIDNLIKKIKERKEEKQHKTKKES